MVKFIDTGHCDGFEAMEGRPTYCVKCGWAESHAIHKAFAENFEELRAFVETKAQKAVDALQAADDEARAATAPKPPTAPEMLARAADIMAERGKRYDKPGGERSMGQCVAAFNIITGQNLSEAEGWLLLQVLKDVRQWQRPGYHADSAEDCIAYAALKAEAKQHEA